MVSARALALCDYAHCDVTTGKTTLLGVFTAVRARAFPTPKLSIYVWAHVVGDAREEGRLALLCREGAHPEWMDTLYLEEVSFAKDQNLYLRVGIGGVSFPRPGLYHFQLTFDGNVIAQATVSVERTSE